MTLTQKPPSEAEVCVREAALRIGLTDAAILARVCAKMKEEFVVTIWQLSVLDSYQWEKLLAPVGLAAAVHYHSVFECHGKGLGERLESLPASVPSPVPVSPENMQKEESGKEEMMDMEEDKPWGQLEDGKDKQQLDNASRLTARAEPQVDRNLMSDAIDLEAEEPCSRLSDSTLSKNEGSDNEALSEEEHNIGVSVHHHEKKASALGTDEDRNKIKQIVEPIADGGQNDNACEDTSASVDPPPSSNVQDSVVDVSQSNTVSKMVENRHIDAEEIPALALVSSSEQDDESEDIDDLVGTFTGSTIAKEDEDEATVVVSNVSSDCKVSKQAGQPTRVTTVSFEVSTDIPETSTFESEQEALQEILFKLDDEDHRNILSQLLIMANARDYASRVKLSYQIRDFLLTSIEQNKVEADSDNAVQLIFHLARLQKPYRLRFGKSLFKDMSKLYKRAEKRNSRKGKRCHSSRTSSKQSSSETPEQRLFEREQTAPNETAPSKILSNTSGGNASIPVA
mmetsp:Transcript_26653/g.43808  ORF Transcript_26653/g.43808 Transcript_26653/m.43808 type:complete len:511 (-) Transcript_26653:65-1597(-)